VAGRLEAAQQKLHRLEHLLGELLGDVGLATAALTEQPRDGILLGSAVSATRAQQELERGEDRAAVGALHRLTAKRQVRGRLAGWRVNQAQITPVAEQAHGDAAAAQQPHKFGRWWVTPSAGALLRFIQIEA